MDIATGQAAELLEVKLARKAQNLLVLIGVGASEFMRSRKQTDRPDGRPDESELFTAYFALANTEEASVTAVQLIALEA